MNTRKENLDIIEGLYSPIAPYQETREVAYRMIREIIAEIGLDSFSDEAIKRLAEKGIEKEDQAAREIERKMKSGIY